MSAVLSLALAALTAATPAAAPSSPDAIIARWVRGTSQERPRINVWLNRDDVYQRGDRARVYFKSDQDAYVTILRVDTDGRVRVLFPLDPWEDNFARGGKTFEVLGRDRDEAFRVDDYPGVGYIFAIAADDPFSYDDIVRGDHWDYRAISDGRVRGDPYVAVSDLADRIAQASDYDYDVEEYDVEKHYDYPRFVCYDCHTYASWRYWDPYSYNCSRFRIVIYDDWYYYPYRYYRGGTVIVRPYRPGARYVFKDYDARNDYITRVAERPRVPDDRRPTVDRGRTSADVGGRGSIPAPVSPRRRTGTAPDAAPNGGTRRRTPETAAPGSSTSPSGGDRRPSNRPETRPQGGTQAPSPNAEPRRQPEPSRGQPEPSTRTRPESGDSPRRRPAASEDRNLRETDAAPRRESSSNRDRGSSGGSEPSSRRDRGSSGGAEPSRTPSTRPEGGNSGGASRAPAREPSRPAPAPRAEPRSEPRSQPAPRSGGGQPELKRRRPN